MEREKHAYERAREELERKKLEEEEVVTRSRRVELKRSVEGRLMKAVPRGSEVDVSWIYCITFNTQIRTTAEIVIYYKCQ